MQLAGVTLVAALLMLLLPRYKTSFASSED
jgi:hypothetical protein